MPSPSPLNLALLYSVTYGHRRSLHPSFFTYHNKVSPHAIRDPVWFSLDRSQMPVEVRSGERVSNYSSYWQKESADDKYTDLVNGEPSFP